MSSFRDLIVWQKSLDLCDTIYKETENFPSKEQFSLTSQIRKCAVSIPSNIAEGHKRGSQKEFKQFLRIAYGSGAELETQLIIANRVGYLKTKNYEEILNLLTEVMKMLNAMIRKL